MKSLFKIFAFAIFLFFGITNLMSAATVDLKGYAWGADNNPFGGVGWINFNNTSTGTNTAVSNTEYKVTFDRTSWELVGYAWSENYGYIRFGGFDDSEFPSAKTACQSNPKNQSTDGPCNVHLVADGAGYKLVGYARYCFVYQSGCSGSLRPNSELGGYDGWIGFKGTSFGVSYSTSDNAFKGFAWGGGHSSTSNANYGEGSGWIKMNPANGGISCAVAAGADCIDDNDKPKVTITASPNPVSHNGDVTLSWTVTNIPNGCTATTSSSPSNSTWNAYTPTGSDIASGTLNVGKIAAATTFTLSCEYNSKKGTGDVEVKLSNFTPQITLSAPSSVTYGQSATLDYTVTNIPYGCSADLLRNGAVIQSNINVTSDGTTTDVFEDSLTVNNMTTTSNWELKCTDNTPPSPSRVGSATAKTTVVVPTPTVTFSVKDTSTNSTSTIPCSNTGVTITYSTKDILAGSCRAMIDSNTSDPDWGASTSITENDSPTTHTVTTGAVTRTGNILYQLQCKKLDGNLWTAGKMLSRSCSAGSLSVSAANACVTPSENIDINYVGSSLVSGSCQRSWLSGNSAKINQSNFNLHYILPASNLTVGQTYTYTVSGCQESSNPNGTPLSQSVNVDVQNTCGTNTTCTGTRCAGKGPVFKEF